MSEPKPRLKASFSGGRSSATMCELLQENCSDKYEIIYTFCNTSFESEDTLRFANDVDRMLGLNLVWLEAVPVHGERISCQHRVVTYETAHRNGEVFAAVASKYGIPNHTFRPCNREMKLNTMNSYCRSIGWKKGSYETAVGIRADEPRRVRRDVAERERIVYPLADWWPTTKEDVLIRWEGRDIDLRIPEHLGNCRACFKKSEAKLHRVYLDDPKAFEFTAELEALFAEVGPNNVPGPRKMFRGYKTTVDLIASFSEAHVRPLSQLSGGCSESCEVFELEQEDYLDHQPLPAANTQETSNER